MAPIDEGEAQRIAREAAMQAVEETTGEFAATTNSGIYRMQQAQQKPGAPWWLVIAGAVVALFCFVATQLMTFGGAQAEIRAAAAVNAKQDSTIEKLDDRKADLAVVHEQVRINTAEHFAINKKLDDILLMLATRRDYPSKPGGTYRHTTSPTK